MSEAFDRAVSAAHDAHDRQDWLAAIDHWSEAVRLNPRFVPGLWMAGGLMIVHGRLAEAEVMLSRGVAVDPAHIPMGIEHAKAATLLKNWPEAIRRWNALSRRAPHDQAVIAARAEAEMQIQMYGGDNASDDGLMAIDWRRFNAGRTASTDTELFTQFQSIGDNCEFGLVQRRFQAEPVSLLRWNSISLPSLIEALLQDFAGLGDPETTELIVGQNDEYVLLDRRYAMAMHTFLKKDRISETADELYVKMRRRQAYLGRTLLEDLAGSDQVFVFKSIHNRGVDDARALHAAMGRHGRSPLLFAVEADAGRPARSVETVAPGLFIGAVSHFSRPGEGWDHLAFDDWRAVCGEVLRRVHYGGGVAGLLKRSAFKARHWNARARTLLARRPAASG